MTNESFNVNDIVTATSRRYGYSDPELKWIVIGIDTDYIELAEDDSLKIELSPPRGQKKLRINNTYLPDFNIKKVD